MPFFLLAGCHKKTAPHAKPAPPVKVAEAISKNVPLYIQTVGHVEAYNTVDIKSQVTGVITKLAFEEGSFVKKGDLLVSIDDRPYLAALHQAKAALSQSAAQLKYHKDTAKRNTPLVKEEYISQNSYENLITNVLVSKAEVKQNQAEVETAEINLSYCTIYAPIDGVAGNHMIDEGNLVIESDSSTITTLKQIMPIYATFYIIEKDLPKVRKLQNQEPLKVLVSYEKDFSEREEGILTFIDNEVDTSTGMIKLKGTFSNENKFLWPGEYVNVRLILSIADNAILIPSEAVNINQKGKYVFVVTKEKRVEMRYVETGQQEDGYTIIKKGIDAGDNVVTEGQINLSDGIKVAVAKE
ncbi:MAG: efflux RND transporter periplasmic adaptor subunit [Simkaniaceae bacterium]